MPSTLRRILPLMPAFLLPYPGHTATETSEQAQQHTQHLGAMPSRGMTMNQVEQRFGQPLKRFDAIGTPPIARWQYDGMIVYFDHEFVIHSVATTDNTK